MDQVVLSQDSVQRNSGLWSFTKYDALGRDIMSGIYTSAVARTAIEAAVNALYPVTGNSLWENRTADPLGYSNFSFPKTGTITYHTVKYYDDYTFPGATD